MTKHNEYIDRLRNLIDAGHVTPDGMFTAIAGGIIDGAGMECDKIERLRLLFDAYRILTDNREMGFRPVGVYSNDDGDAGKTYERAMPAEYHDRGRDWGVHITQKDALTGRP
ncbi:hypothetical protein [Sporosarcina phage Lietuvens]|nr:hypothetical protein [Sporosarcina phage Lietuvens]